MVLVDCQLTRHEPLSAAVGELDGVDAAKVAEHVLLKQTGAARQSAPLEVLLHERLPGELSAGQEAHGGAHTAAIQLLHGSAEPNLKTHEGRGGLSPPPQTPPAKCLNLALHHRTMGICHRVAASTLWCLSFPVCLPMSTLVSHLLCLVCGPSSSSGGSFLLR